MCLYGDFMGTRDLCGPRGRTCKPKMKRRTRSHSLAHTRTEQIKLTFLISNIVFFFRYAS